jgi:perosamine synthetase
MSQNWKIPVAQPDISEEELEAVVEVMRSGWITQGKKVREFEERFASFCGVSYAVATSSGTSSIHTALMALGVRKDDEIITTPLSCIATTNPILLQSAKPVFTDIDSKTLNIDINGIGEKITSKTKGVIAVHLFGHPVDMDPLMEIAKKHNLWVIEDASQAHGAEYKGRRVGSIGDIGCFSLYINKIITTGEGGIGVTRDKWLAEKMRQIRDFGEHKSIPFSYPILGYNYKLTDIQAAIGLVQMKKIDGFIKQRRENVSELNKRLEGHPWIESLPSESSYAKSVYFSYHIQTFNKEQKKKLYSFLKDNGIEPRPFFCLIPDQPPYQDMGYKTEGLTKTIDAYNRGFYISNSPLLNIKDIEYISKTFWRVVEE